MAWNSWQVKYELAKAQLETELLGPHDDEASVKAHIEKTISNAKFISATKAGDSKNVTADAKAK